VRGRPSHSRTYIARFDARRAQGPLSARRGGQEGGHGASPSGVGGRCGGCAAQVRTAGAAALSACVYVCAYVCAVHDLRACVYVCAYVRRLAEGLHQPYLALRYWRQHGASSEEQVRTVRQWFQHVQALGCANDYKHHPTHTVNRTLFTSCVKRGLFDTWGRVVLLLLLAQKTEIPGP
jgi:hypothetical protein